MSEAPIPAEMASAAPASTQLRTASVGRKSEASSAVFFSPVFTKNTKHLLSSLIRMADDASLFRPTLLSCGIIESRSSVAESVRERRLAAMRLQEIESNPLDPEQIAMFEMFEREGWSHERRRAYILAKARPLAAE